MRASFALNHGRRFLLLLAAVTLGCALRAAPIELSGVYADEGTVVSGDPTLFTSQVSLHALLRLEFDPRLASQRREETSEVRLTHTAGVLAVEAYEADGTLSWRSRWNAGEGRSSLGRVVTLRMRAAHAGADDYLLVLEPVNSQLLQVRIQRLEPTLLGPMVRATGVYLFSRCAEPSPSAR
ncbi:hypothetical protein [Opitutus terrae]|uniref:Uncharacterized protein n=1 Tax=Opitutus terrae (strain DSM 11246 / JCM 15787 / PB90-1) TaxID=452637 RepID=B1ZZK1_OPITP|nr:hypothetical protein [Opitutus terrae]ACB76404.1 hypothetical protein Oter_3124 [Opitutus terrae PB90-1]